MWALFSILVQCFGVLQGTENDTLKFFVKIVTVFTQFQWETYFFLGIDHLLEVFQSDKIVVILNSNIVTSKKLNYVKVTPVCQKSDLVSCLRYINTQLYCHVCTFTNFCNLVWYLLSSEFLLSVFMQAFLACGTFIGRGATSCMF